MQRKILIIGFMISALLFTSSVYAYENQDETMGLYVFKSELGAFWVLYDQSDLADGTEPTNDVNNDGVEDQWEEILAPLPDDAERPQVDTADGDAGEQMGAFFENNPVREGTITHLKVRCYNTLKISGWVYDAETELYYYTDSSVPNVFTSSRPTKPTENDCDEITLSPPDDDPNYDFDEYMDDYAEVTGGINVVEGEEVLVSIVFNLDDQIRVEEVSGPQGELDMMILPGDEMEQPTITQIFE